MPQQQTLAVTLNLFLVQIICGVLYYFEASQSDARSDRKVANLAMVAIGDLLQLCFLAVTLRFCGKNCHRKAISWLSQAIPFWVIVVLLLVGIVFMVTAGVCILYSYFSHNENYSDKWIYQTNLWISFTSIIYCGQIIKTYKGQTRPTNYSIYLLILILGILYCAQVPIFTRKLAFGTEIYLQFVLILLSMKVFWERTPLLFQLTILSVEIVCLDASIRFLLESQPKPQAGSIAVESIKCVLLLVHSAYCLGSTIHRIYLFIKQLREVKEDMPMKLSAILSLQKIRLSHSMEDLGQAEVSELHVMRKQQECSICMVELKLGSEIYLIPCRHQFHCECLKEWLLVKNWCPICHTQVD